MQSDIARSYNDFTLDSIDAFTSIHHAGHAKRILDRLITRSEPPAEILRRIVVSSKPDALLEHVVAAYAGSAQWREFLEAAAGMPEGTWRSPSAIEPLDPAIVMQAVSPADLRALVEHAPNALSDPDNGLFSDAAADAYWTKVVRRYIATRDYRRAWDELKKAGRGINISGSRYVFTLTVRTAAALIRELHESMVKDHALPAWDGRGRIVTTSRMQSWLYDAWMKSVTVDVKGHERFDDPRPTTAIPGLKFAAQFARVRPVENAMGMGLFILAPEGAYTLNIAKHFSQQRKEARNDRRGQKVTEYCTQHHTK